MLNRSASLAMSTSVLKALSGKLDIKRHSPSILYISASLAMSTSVLIALSGKLDIKRHSPSILYLLSPWSSKHLYFSQLNLGLNRWQTPTGRGGSRISEKGVHMYNGVGVCFADFISFFLNIPSFGTKLFHFYRIFKKRRTGSGFERTPWTSSGFATV